MKRCQASILVSSFLLLFFCSVAFSQEAKDIVKQADERERGKTSLADMSIEIVRPTWKRTMNMKTWTKGNDLAMILVTAPAKDKGIAYLKRKKEVWNWIPSIERNIKMPPSMMNQSWMGTDFTNDDLVKEASIVEDYDHSKLNDTMIDGRSCFTIQMITKPQAAVVWGKVMMWIDKKDFIMMHALYYDEENVLINTMHCSDIKMLGGRLLPGKMEMIPADKPGNMTVLIYHSIIFDKEIEDNFFTAQRMPYLQ
jgi:outer membrane lipoprotein-sorting protein